MQGMLDNLNVGTLLTVFVVLVLSITLHEAMHAFTSHWLGDDTAEREGRISLNPLRHVDPFATILLPLITLVLFQVPLLAAKPVPFNPNRVRFDEFGAALVGVAGPLTNLLLAMFGAGLLRLFGSNLGLGVTDVLSIFVLINVGLFVFNMIPIPPLDGSRVLYAFAPEPVQRFMSSLEQFGIFIVFGLVLMVPGFTQLLVDLNSRVLNLLF
jgi:Zn-dependent protease